MGVQGLMKAYIGKPLFAGEWSDKLDNCTKVYDNLSSMCQLTDDEKLTGIPIILTANAFDVYAEHAEECRTYEDAKQLLQAWYNNAEKQSRVLMEWQKLGLSREMRKRPNATEVQVLTDFVATLQGLRKQLDESHHHDRYLRDRLLAAIDVPFLQDPLRYRMPRTAQHTIQGTMRRLSDKPKTAGSLAAHAAISVNRTSEEEVDASEERENY